MRDDSEMTDNLVNLYLNDAIAEAAKLNYKEAIQIDGIGYVNNSFYTSFKGIDVVPDEQFIYKLTLPQVPIGLGKNEGVSTLEFKLPDGSLSLTAIPISENEVGYYRSMRPIPNKILYWPEGTFLYAQSTIPLWRYKANVRMVSGGDASDLESTINVPDDYFRPITDYIRGQLNFEKMTPKDLVNDGASNPG